MMNTYEDFVVRAERIKAEMAATVSASRQLRELTQVRVREFAVPLTEVRVGVEEQISSRRQPPQSRQKPELN